MTDEEYRAKSDELEGNRIDVHLAIVLELLEAATLRIHSARGSQRTFQRPNMYAAETHLRAALSVLEHAR